MTTNQIINMMQPAVIAELTEAERAELFAWYDGEVDELSDALLARWNAIKRSLTS